MTVTGTLSYYSAIAIYQISMVLSGIGTMFRFMPSARKATTHDNLRGSPSKYWIECHWRTSNSLTTCPDQCGREPAWYTMQTATGFVPLLTAAPRKALEHSLQLSARNIK